MNSTKHYRPSRRRPTGRSTASWRTSKQSSGVVFELAYVRGQTDRHSPLMGD